MPASEVMVSSPEDVPPRRFPPRLWTRRMLWCPTFTGWIILVFTFAASASGWLLYGEDYLAVTDRRGADVLVVEGWIGNSGVRAAAAEFFSGHYRYVIATSGLTSNRWDKQQWSYAEMAQRDLLAAGVPPEKILLAIPQETGEQRTFESARAAQAALAGHAVVAPFITVFTLGAHARRSRLIFSKVFHPATTVSVVAWRPANDYAQPWWHSSDRAEDFLKETFGLLFEFFFNSGRGFHRL